MLSSGPGSTSLPGLRILPDLQLRIYRNLSYTGGRFAPLSR